MRIHARLNAKSESQVLFYIPAIDRPNSPQPPTAYDAFRAFPNISKTQKLMGILPVFAGMEMILSESYLPPKIVRGTPVEVVGIEFHEQEPDVPSRDSFRKQGCAVLVYMPKCIYVRVADCSEVFLTSSDAPVQCNIEDLRGVLAVQPVSRQWQYQAKSADSVVTVVRTQIPLLPQKQCTLHGVQGKTAEPGFIAHWKFPNGVSSESIWLGYYVSLSRPRSLSNFLCHGIPDRSIIEGGPPDTISSAFSDYFSKKIATTKKACKKAREVLGWPARKPQ